MTSSYPIPVSPPGGMPSQTHLADVGHLLFGDALSVLAIHVPSGKILPIHDASPAIANRCIHSVDALKRFIGRRNFSRIDALVEAAAMLLRRYAGSKAIHVIHTHIAISSRGVQDIWAYSIAPAGFNVDGQPEWLYLSLYRPTEVAGNPDKAILICKHTNKAFAMVYKKGRWTGSDTPLLSDREVEVLSLAMHGDTSDQIAERLLISTPTVKKHKTAIIAKLNARNLMDAARKAVRLGIVPLY